VHVRPTDAAGQQKVYSGAIPDAVQLENSQVQRALSTDRFFLVVVGNVEDGRGDPEVRIIVSPLQHLKILPTGSVTLGGVQSATALRYTAEKS
jgi:hypothetical protein